MKQPRLYVAYGSNLNRKQMQHRCPTAKLVGSGVLHDYALQFKGQAHCAFATIAPQKGATTPVAVWEIQKRDEEHLDAYEGYPTHYFKENVSVEMNDGKTVEGMVYIMNQRMTFGLPSTHYYRTVLEGYRDCRLDPSHLRDALGKSCAEFYTERVTKQFTLTSIDDENWDLFSGPTQGSI